MKRGLTATIAGVALAASLATVAPATVAPATAAPATAVGPGTAVAGTPHDEDGSTMPEQWRSVWVDAFNEGIYTPEQVQELVDEATAMNVNALIVQTARRYDCFCNRALYPRTDAAIAPAPYDPLDEIIERAHDAGIEVHAWVTVNTMWNVPDGPPSSPDHIYNTHGPGAEGRDRWIGKMADGREIVNNRVYLDPGHPDAAGYVTAAVSGIAREYDVDGINLDYIRYPDLSSTSEYSEWGYNDVAVARFQEATGRTDVPAPDDEEWSQWRRDQVTALVRRIYLTLWEIDPSLRLSMDAITYGNGPDAVGGWTNTRTYAEVLQDWVGWLDEGIMDTAVTMNYKRDHVPAQEVMFDEWSEFLADNQAGRQAVNGPALYLNSIDHSVAQARQAVTPSEAGNTAAGWSGYSYANPSQEVVADPALRDAQQAALAEALTGPGGIFEDDAAVPDMPWKSAPDDGHVTGTLTAGRGGPVDQVTVTLRPLGPGPAYEQVTDGSGWFGFAHVPPGRYLVWADLGGETGNIAGGGRTVMGLVRVEEGEITEVRLR
ncbi:family 10 glycosylhydrolase [Myceligenerans pegani]|uniref:Family 10 glycosylhydrolase n=1 Tax=Myceligenerans pegani TaxID=2776917 RepID=A0ABR9N2L0_9MICO|nr:family 10 glycosylhydrolase [Myceligenerans sp. TRM 65318]MBE1877389.1 family 10 glycosylhydrolase [Myceligenerans sp. TRM 65318]MBE3019660.1 family 10 glycosylhydrolase [Myceligenerans sp. TRM 65318]